MKKRKEEKAENKEAEQHQMINCVNQEQLFQNSPKHKHSTHAEKTLNEFVFSNSNDLVQDFYAISSQDLLCRKNETHFVL